METREYFEKVIQYFNQHRIGLNQQIVYDLIQIYFTPFYIMKVRDSKPQQVMSEEEKLRDENARLRKALEYSELRNEALNEVLKIGKEQYGIDLLKKAGAKQ